MNQDRRADTGFDRLPGELVDWLAKPFASFLRIEAAGGAILLVVTIAALALSNSPWADPFLTFWELPVGIRIGSLEVTPLVAGLDQRRVDDAVLFRGRIGAQARTGVGRA